MAKLEMVFWVKGYPRVSKVLKVSGPYKDWSNSNQLFLSSTEQAMSTNKILFDLKNKYQKVAQEWTSEERLWNPKELSHCFDEENEVKQTSKSLSVLEMIDHLIEGFRKKEKIKNGRIVTSLRNSKKYVDFKKALSEFTKVNYGRALSSYFFKDINEQFLLDFTLFTKKKGIEQGNKAGLTGKLRLLRAVCNHAKSMGLHGVNPDIFECVGEDIKWPETQSKAVSQITINLLKNLDRSLFSEKEQLYLDLFFFSYYSGGMANVDVCNMTWDWINYQDGIIEYERTKFPKKARPIIMQPALDILEKYKGKCYRDYVFPIFLEKHHTDIKRFRRLNNITTRVSETLGKACCILQITEKVTWYSARGSFITAMVDQGYKSMQVAEMAGNSARIIEKHYYKNTKREQIKEHMHQFL